MIKIKKNNNKKICLEFQFWVRYKKLWGRGVKLKCVVQYIVRIQCELIEWFCWKVHLSKIGGVVCSNVYSLSKNSSIPLHTLCYMYYLMVVAFYRTGNIRNPQYPYAEHDSVFVPCSIWSDKINIVKFK